MDTGLYLRQLEVGLMQNFVYLIGDPKARQCVVVDPAWDVPGVLEIAEKDGMEVTGGLLTHTHYDHANGVEDLLAKTGGKIYVHEKEAGFLKGMKDRLEKVEEGYCLKLGDLEISFLHTPGHTPGSQCFLVKDHLISGDTLFINACGRCDTVGGSAEQMYQSLTRLAKLGDHVAVLPGHNYDEKPVSTIGEEKRNNPYYQLHSLSDFLALRMEY